MNASARASVPPFSATFAFQPIVDIAAGGTYAYEALVRGKAGESAGVVLGAVGEQNLHRFDRDARAAAIHLATSLGLKARLSLNCLPQSLDTLPDAVSSMLDAARACNIAPNRLILEVTEGEMIRDRAAFAAKLNGWRAEGLGLAIDDFGAGYSGLNLLAEFQPDIVKIDMELVRAIDRHGPRQAIVRAVLQASRDLGLEVIAEGVETEEEFRWFRRHGVVLFQGYYFARPVFEQLTDAAFGPLGPERPLTR